MCLNFQKYFEMTLMDDFVGSIDPKYGFFLIYPFHPFPISLVPSACNCIVITHICIILCWTLYLASIDDIIFNINSQYPVYIFDFDFCLFIIFNLMYVFLINFFINLILISLVIITIKHINNYIIINILTHFLILFIIPNP